jgi:hypothetical protein
MPRPQANSELLAEGCRSYHKALYAVMQFGREAQEEIHAAINGRIDDMGAALRLDKSELSAGLTAYATPAKLGQSWDGSEASVGLRYPNRDYESKWGVYFYLWIGAGEEACVVASCWFREPEVAMQRLASLAVAGLRIDGTGAWIEERIDGTPDSFSGAVAQVLDRWIEVWRKVGGIQQFLPPSKANQAGV